MLLTAGMLAVFLGNWRVSAVPLAQEGTPSPPFAVYLPLGFRPLLPCATPTVTLTPTATVCPPAFLLAHVPALAADAVNSITCASMAGTVFVGLALNAWLGWWWAEAAAALAFLVWLGRETWEAFEEARRGQVGQSKH